MLSKWVAEPPIPPLRAKTLTPEKASDFLHSGRYAPDVQKDARGVRAFGLLCGNKGTRQQTSAQNYLNRVLLVHKTTVLISAAITNNGA